MQAETSSLEQQAHEEWLRSRARCIPLAKLAAGAILPPPPLFNGFLLHETLTMLSAEPFTGKSLLMLAMAISLSSGKPLFGRHLPAELRRCLFIGQDSPTWDYARQALKLLRGYEIPSDGYDLEVDLVLNQGVRITDPQFVDGWLAPWHEETGFDVLMIDTLLSVHGADENDNRQMSAVMQVLKTIRDKFHCAVIFSHHLSKPRQDTQTSANYMARGASAIVASVDFHFQLQAADGGQVNLLMPKGRGADGMEPPSYFTIMAEGSQDEDRALRLVAPSEDERTAKLISMLREPRTTKDLTAAVLLAEPLLGQKKAAKWIDNELQRLKRSGLAESPTRGVWVLRS